MNQSPSPLTVQRMETPPLAGSLRVALLTARWHQDIVQHAEQGFLDSLQQHSPCPVKVDIFAVPGALEIPLHARRLAQFGHYDAVVAIAFVIDGGIYRHEFVASAVIDGLMRVQLDTGVPVISAVLTPKTYQADPEQTAFFRTHFVKKGEEAAHACLATVASLRGLQLHD